jgi:hypothetical protein
MQINEIPLGALLDNLPSQDYNIYFDQTKLCRTSSVFSSPIPFKSVVGCIHYITAHQIFSLLTEDGGLSKGPN